MEYEYLLNLEGITKKFPGVLALDNVDFDLKPGEVHALLGENGAGKSTLLKILSGAHTADSGEIKVKGKPVKIASTDDAHQKGISIIYQELLLAYNMKVYENITLGKEPRAGCFINKNESIRECKRCLDLLGIDVDCNADVEDLSVAMQQIVEIAKALSWNANIIAMDEPTSSLTESEIEALFELIERLKQSGSSIIYVSHRMDEIFRIADRVTVLRDGKKIGTHDIKDCSRNDLIKMMVGHEVDESYAATELSYKNPLMEIQNISEQKILKNVSFQVYPGEILGIAGLVGSGRSTLLKVLLGEEKITEGSIIFEGRETRFKHPADAVAKGIGLVPEDRKLSGLFLSMSVAENISIAWLNNLFPSGFISRKKEEKLTKNLIDRLGIRTPSIFQEVNFLSGGNQQKVVIGKWLTREPKIFLMDDPTRGIDVAAKKQIHTIIKNLAKNNISIIFSSSELPELLNIADRIMVLKEGEVKATIKRAEATKEKILQYAM